MSVTNPEPRQFVLLKHVNHIAEGTSIKATRTKEQMLEAGEMGATTRLYSFALSVASMKRGRQVTHLTRQSRQLTFCQGAFVLVGGVFCAPPLFRNNFWIGAEYQHETCMLSDHQFDVWLKNINPTDFSCGPDTVRPARLTSACLYRGRCHRPQPIPARSK